VKSGCFVSEGLSLLANLMASLSRQVDAVRTVTALDHGSGRWKVRFYGRVVKLDSDTLMLLRVNQ
jgi:hypothetical protein